MKVNKYFLLLATGAISAFNAMYIVLVIQNQKLMTYL